MSTYREIIGKKIKKVSSDPSSGIEGEMWYNSTTGTLRGPAILEGWSSAAPLAEGRSLAGTVGTSTAGLAFGGEPGPASPAETTASEEWNGTGWTAGGALPTATRSMGSFGTQTAAIACGGLVPGSPGTTNTTHSYNGTSWSNTGHAVSYTAYGMQGCGTSTAGVIYGGAPILTTTAEYDGEGWTAGNAMSNGRMQHGGSPQGTQSAALSSSGVSSPGPGTVITAVEQYDGTNWSSETALPAGRFRTAAAGTATANLLVAGYSAPYTSGSLQTSTYKYDGTSWTSGVAYPTAAQQGAGFGTQSSAVIAGFNPPAGKSAVYEYNISTNAYTPGAWASGNSMTTGRRGAGGAGTQTAALAIGGEAPRTGKTESYDGSSWTEVGDLNTARNTLGATGSSTAALAFGGEAPGPSTHTETWNG